MAVSWGFQTRKKARREARDKVESLCLTPENPAEIKGGCINKEKGRSGTRDSWVDHGLEKRCRIGRVFLKGETAAVFYERE